MVFREDKHPGQQGRGITILFVPLLAVFSDSGIEGCGKVAGYHPPYEGMFIGWEKIGQSRHTLEPQVLHGS